ncbi:hypothetical protein [Embleya hyalina]|uniref:hypothetical protein n=1 Tax=Embleya hyalina TaxID=516124 RepID=UPI000F842451|nr:hypothetical protein [Embleya hyalina]
MNDDADRATKEFAAWLRRVHREHGKGISVRAIEQATTKSASGTRVPRSTISAALNGTNLPTYDNAMAIVRAMNGDSALLRACHERWIAARARRTGDAPEASAPSDTRSAAPEAGNPAVPEPTSAPSPPPRPRHPPARPGGTGRRRGPILAAAGVALALAVVPAGIGIHDRLGNRSSPGGKAGGGGASPAADPDFTVSTRFMPQDDKGLSAVSRDEFRPTAA